MDNFDVLGDPSAGSVLFRFAKHEAIPRDQELDGAIDGLSMDRRSPVDDDIGVIVVGAYDYYADNANFVGLSVEEAVPVIFL